MCFSIESALSINHRLDTYKIRQNNFERTRMKTYILMSTYYVDH